MVHDILIRVTFHIFKIWDTKRIIFNLIIAQHIQLESHSINILFDFNYGRDFNGTIGLNEEVVFGDLVMGVID